jgi:hypothetical protein
MQSCRLSETCFLHSTYPALAGSAVHCLLRSCTSTAALRYSCDGFHTRKFPRGKGFFRIVPTSSWAILPACLTPPTPPAQSGVEVLLFEAVAAPLRSAAAAAGAVALRPEGSGTLPALLDALLHPAPAGTSRTVRGAAAADAAADGELRADAGALAEAAALAALYVAVESDHAQRLGQPGGPEAATSAAAAAAAARLACALGLEPQVGGALDGRGGQRGKEEGREE